MEALNALADPIRREIVEVLMDRPEDAGTLAARFPVSRPAVSRHLRVLREAGLVRVEADAQRRVYHAEVEPLREVDEWLARYRVFWADRLDRLEDHLTKEA